jgi:hypothetical protein
MGFEEVWRLKWELFYSWEYCDEMIMEYYF